MDMTGLQRIEAPREAVYAALNDVDVLRQCIPGCETIEKTDDQVLKDKVTLKIGPMKVVLSGAVSLSDLDPAQRLYDQRRRSRWDRGVRKGVGCGATRARWGCDAAALHSQGRDRRQDRPTRSATDRRHREETGGRSSSPSSAPSSTGDRGDEGEAVEPGTS